MEIEVEGRGRCGDGCGDGCGDDCEDLSEMLLLSMIAVDLEMNVKEIK